VNAMVLIGVSLVLINVLFLAYIGIGGRLAQRRRRIRNRRRAAERQPADAKPRRAA
jgi:hypothetical protein